MLPSNAPPALVRLAREFYFQYKRDKWAAIPWGWSPLGFGFYSGVFQHDDYPDYAVKISGAGGFGEAVQGNVYEMRESIERRSKRHDAWPTFAEYCSTVQHDNLPRVLYLERLTEYMTLGIMPIYSPLGRGHDAHRDYIIAQLNGYEPTEEWLWPIRQMKSGLYIEVDLHDNNWMQDDYGNLILLDPFSTTGES